MITLVSRLRDHAERQGDRPTLTFLGPGGEAEATLTFADLDARAGRVAALLRETCAPGDRAVLLFSPGLDYVAAFWGCLYAGVVAVPVYLPVGDRQLPRLAAIVQDSEPAVALSTRAVLARCGPGLPALFERVVVLDDLPTDPVAPTPHELAFLQYTSGSTGTPRGVRVSHANLEANHALIASSFGFTPRSAGLIWLPPYHDMGLISGLLQPIYSGCEVRLMSPLAFLKHPLGWLKAISRHRIDITGGPNFAYDLCASRARPEDLEGLDLSCWRVAFNGAEPIREDTLARFTETFAPHGFRRQAFFTCYGLAEATLIVSGGGAITFELDGAALEQGRVAPGEDRVLVGCGPVLAGEVTFVDPETGRPSAPDEVGEICLTSPSVARGYWRQPDLEGPLHTGDLGFLRDGQLVVTGRLKDLVILDGRNVYPQDLEATAERAHPAVRPGGVAAFGIPFEGSERLVLAVEVARHGGEGADKAVRQAVAAEHGVEVHAVKTLLPGALPRTSSGKLRRRATRDAYLAGDL